MSQEKLFSLRRTNDLKLVNELDIEAFPSDYRLNLAGAWWLLRRGDEVAGFCGIRHIPALNYGFLCRAAIRDKFQGCGQQKVMIRRRLAYAKQHGWLKVITYTLPDNYPSANNLIRCGFKLYEPQLKWAGKDCLYWTCSTTPST